MLDGKRLLLTGVLTRKSIAFAVAREAQLAGAELVLTGFGRTRRMTERAAARLPERPDVLELDINSEDDLSRLANELEQRWGGVDGVLHAIAFAPQDAIGGQFLKTPPESAVEAFRTSAYSYQALARHLAPLMEEGGSVVGLDFDASVAWPAYDWMGVSKAALSASWPEVAPLGWDSDDPTPVARAVCFLLSDWSSAISGELIHVDGGAHAVAGVSPAEVASNRVVSEPVGAET